MSSLPGVRVVWRQCWTRSTPRFCGRPSVRWLSASAAGGLLGAAVLMPNRPLSAQEVGVRQEVWAWGRRQGIPGGSDSDMLRPARIRWFETHKPGWKKLAFGPSFGAALDRNNNMFVWGVGERQTDDGLEEIFVGPVAVDITGEARGERFVDIQCSSQHIFALTARGASYVFEGVEDTMKASNSAPNMPMPLEGRRMPGIPQPKWLHRFLGGGGVAQMSIGLEHAAFVSHRGELLCTGSNQWGQCGEQPPKREKQMGALEEVTRIETANPVRVTFPKNTGRIVSVSVGGHHTVAMDDSGQTFSFGDDRRIQLGLGDTRTTAGVDERTSGGVLNRENLGAKGTMDLKRAATYKYYDPHMQAAPVEMIPPPVQNRPAYPPASFVACGQDFTVTAHRDSPDWYSEDKETNLLFSCGENGEGQCGRNRQQQQSSWQSVRLPKRSRTTGVACGQGHCIALLASGELFAWGLNQQGEVGVGNRASIVPPRPVVVPPLEDGSARQVVGITCGFRNSACICEVPSDKE